MAEAFIVATARTAGGRKGGRLAGWHPADLAATVLDSLVARSGAEQLLDPGRTCRRLESRAPVGHRR